MEKASPYLVSECLCGVPCRMDGKSKLVQEVKALLDAGLAVPVCPEVMGGLPTPRIPSERRGDRVMNQAGQDVTKEFILGAEKALAVCRAHGCAAAILKSKSPSCGCGLIHNGLFDGGLVPGNGILTDLLIKNGVSVMTEKEYIQSLTEE